MLLRPQYYQVDDILRAPYAPGAPFWSGGEFVRAGSPQGWGFAGDVFVGGSDGTDTNADACAPFTLAVFADGEPVFPGDGISRPSHVTLHGRHEPSGLQVTEDKFITGGDVVVSVLSVRNPGERSVDFELDLRWNLAGGEHRFLGLPLWVRRDGPPGDDLRQSVGENGRRTLVTAVSFAPTKEEAVRRAARWIGEPDPVRAQASEYQEWFGEKPRFDCSDADFMRLWYQRAVEAKRGDARAEEWLAHVLARLPGITSGGAASGGTIRLAPDIPRGWTHFCLQNVPHGNHLLTLVWDDPREWDDQYADGDKGLTLYVDERRVHHQNDLAPFSTPLILSRAG